jgi:hypothetical protein
MLFNKSKYSDAQLDGLVMAVNRLRPGTEIADRVKEWKAIKDPEARSSAVTSFFYMHDITGKIRKDIKNEVFKIIIPWRKLRVALGILVISTVVFLLGLRTYQYYQLQKIYTYGRSVPIYSDAGSQIPVAYLSLSGSAIDTTHKKVRTKMLLVKNKDGYLAIRKPDLFGWIVSPRANCIIRDRSQIIRKEQYEEFTNIFSSILEDPGIEQLSDSARWIIWKWVTDSSSVLKGAKISNDWPKNLTRKDHYKAESFNHAGLTHIFARLETTSGNYNYFLTGNFNRAPEKLIAQGKIIDQPVLFNEEDAVPPSSPPTIKIASSSGQIFHSTGNPEFFYFFKD